MLAQKLKTVDQQPLPSITRAWHLVKFVNNMLDRTHCWGYAAALVAIINIASYAIRTAARGWFVTNFWYNRQTQSIARSLLSLAMVRELEWESAKPLVTISGWSIHLTILILAKFCQKSNISLWGQ